MPVLFAKVGIREKKKLTLRVGNVICLVLNGKKKIHF